MAMQRFQRIAQVWNWLPAFRGVAEHQSVHQAAKVLSISPSALSRMVKLLEADLGNELFVRHPGGLKLTPFGSALLAITRDAMRMVDDGIAKHVGGSERATISIGVTSGVAAAVVARTLPLEGAGARISHVLRIAESNVTQELLQGNLDVAVSVAASTSATLISERLGDARASVYGAPEHPLAKARGRVTARQLDGASFVAITNEPHVASTVPGQITTWCNSPEIARVLCEGSMLLCVLPDAALSPRSSRLVRLAGATATTLFLIRRQPLAHTSDDVVPLLAASLRAALE